MKWFNIFFAIYWAVLAITAWCGYAPSNFSIGCGFLCAAVGFLGSACDENL